jgi:N-acetylglucosaminyl-diphospho-decaprenol L-rhamnosyltransferase
LTEPTVTIVVVAHSVRHELERCFDSIRRHAEVPTAVILVDNASDDDTREWVRAEHPDVEVVELGENLGVAARDHGLRRSQSPYTMFLDSDAALTPGALPTLVAALEENPSWGLVGPRLVHDDGQLQRSARRFPPTLLPILRRPPLVRFFEDRRTVRRHLMADFDHAATRPVLYVLGACQLFRTSLAHTAGPFDDRVFLGWDDADWCFRIRDAGGEIVFVSEAEVVHSYRRQTRQEPLSRAGLRQLQAFVYFQRMYRSRRRELIDLSEQLDRAAEAGDTWTRSGG